MADLTPADLAAEAVRAVNALMNGRSPEEALEAGRIAHKAIEGLLAAATELEAENERVNTLLLDTELALAAATREPPAPPVPVAWRYVPSDVWKSYVYTDDPEKVKLAREFQRPVEALGVIAHPSSAPVLPLAEMEARKDAAYLERNQVVAALARCFPSGIARTAIEGWSEDWHGCVFIDLPTGQASWHFHDSHAYLFTGLPPYTKPWDGHTTAEKYERLAALAAPHSSAQPAEPIPTPGRDFTFAALTITDAPQPGRAEGAGPMTFDQWFLEEQGRPYGGIWAFGRAAWNAALGIQEQPKENKE